MFSLSQHLLPLTIQGKDMNTNDNSENEDKICPHCRKTFSSHSVRNRHLQRGVCVKPGSPAEPPAIILNEDHEGLLVGHTCPYSKYNCYSLPLGLVITIPNVRYRISQLLNLTNAEVYPPLSSCTIPGGVSVCPTTDTDIVRLNVLVAAKNHGVKEISVPKKG